jgi:hypothetical protein
MVKVLLHLMVGSGHLVSRLRTAIHEVMSQFDLGIRRSRIRVRPRDFIQGLITLVILLIVHVCSATPWCIANSERMYSTASSRSQPQAWKSRFYKFAGDQVSGLDVKGCE